MSDDDRRSTMDVLRGSRILAYSVGVLTLAAGAVLLFWPDRTIVVVARLAGILIGVVGIGELIEAVTHRSKGSYWGLLLLRGAANLVAGGLLLFWPDITTTVLVWVFGLDLVLTGIVGLIASRQVPKDLRSSLTLRSIIGILFGIVVMAWPSATLSVVAIIVALQLVAIGLLLLWSGYQLSRAERDLA